MGAIDLSAYLWPDVDQGRLPQAARVRINRNNALGKRVAYYCPLGTDLVDAVSGKQATNNGSTLALSPTGPERNFVPGNSQSILLPSNDLVSGYPLTVAGEVRVGSTDGTGYILYCLCGTAYKAILGCGYVPGKWLVNTSSATVDGHVCAASIGRQRFLCIHRNGTFDLYINGVRQLQTNSSTDLTEPAAGNHAIGQRIGGFSPRYFSGSAKDFTVFYGELSPAEIASYFADPRQFLIPENTAIYAPPPPATGTIGASGSAVASGTAATASVVAASASGGGVVSGTANLSGGASGTMAADGMVIADGTAGQSVAVALSGAGTVQVTGTAGQSVAVALSGAGISITSGSAGGTVTVNIAAAALAQAAATAGISASVLMAGAGAAAASSNATLAALLNALATGVAQVTGSATLSASGPPGTLQANGQVIADATAALRVTVYLAASGGAVSGGSATISGPPLSSLSGAGGALSTGGATAAVSVSMTADAFVRAMGTGALSFTFDGELLQPGPLAWRAVETPRYYTVREARAA